MENSQLLNNINKLIKITEDNIFVQAKNYGLLGVVNNIITQLFSDDVVTKFDDLVQNLDYAVIELNINRTQLKHNEELLNKAIYKCTWDDGKCIVSNFFDSVNQVIALIVDKLIDLYIEDNYHEVLVLVTSLEDIAVHNKLLYYIYDCYLEAIDKDNFNKSFAKIRSSNIDNAFIKQKIKFLDDHVVATIKTKVQKSKRSLH